MKAVIMAGGFGTRLRPLTYNIPKPMAPVMNKPMLEHIILLLKKYGIKDIIVLLYFQPHVITEYFKDGENWGVHLRYIYAESDYGTAGSVKNAEELLTERFIIISGDVLTDFDLDYIVQFHQQKGAEATIALCRQTNPLQYGVVITSDDGKITRFLEKPSWGQVFSDTINTGVYILETRVLERIPFHEEFDFSKDLFPVMLRGNAPLYGCIVEGYWKDVGNLNEYLQSNFDALNGRVQLSLSEYQHQNGCWIHPTAKVDPQAKIQPPVLIGPHATIGAEAIIERSIIGANCAIHPQARIQESVLWDGVTVGANSQLRQDVIGYRSRVGSGSFISENCFISDDVTIGNEATIKANVKIWPNKEVESGATLNSSLILGDRWLRELFNESKVIGLVNSEITPEFASKLGAALGAMVGMDKTVMVARDSSTACRMVNRGIITGLMSTGIQVYDLRNIPIPIVRHQLRTHSVAAGVVSRLSPRHPETVEIIFLDSDGSDLAVKKQKSIERLFSGEDFFRASSDKIGPIDFPIQVTDRYRSDFLSQVNAEAIQSKNFKVVIDFSFGGASQILPPILGRLGVKVVALNAYLEGHRLEHDPIESRKTVQEVQKIVPVVNADVGFILNASAEKILVIDGSGNFFDHQQLMLAIGQLALETYGYKKMAVPVDASILIEKICSQKGCDLIYTSGDHQGMMNAVIKQNVPFVAGTRGGFIFSNFQFSSDGMYNIAKILEMLALSNQTLHDLLKKLPPLYIRKTTVPCPWDKKGQVMRNLIKNTEGQKRLLVDGVRLILEQGTVLFIPDKEKAYFHLQTDAPTAELSEMLLQKYVDYMNSWKS